MVRGDRIVANFSYPDEGLFAQPEGKFIFAMTAGVLGSFSIGPTKLHALLDGDSEWKKAVESVRPPRDEAISVAAEGKPDKLVSSSIRVWPAQRGDYAVSLTLEAGAVQAYRLAWCATGRFNESIQSPNPCYAASGA